MREEGESSAKQAFWIDVLTAEVVGTVIALFQAPTHIQEMTLTFVPTIVAVLVVLSLTASFIGSQLSIFPQQCYSRIEAEGRVWASPCQPARLPMMFLALTASDE